MRRVRMDRKRVLRTIAGWVWLVAVPVVGSSAQNTGRSAAAVPETLCGPAPTSEGAFEPEGQVLRQIEDPSTGDLWLLLRDRKRPGGPARMVLARQRVNVPRTISGGPVQHLFAGERPLIHPGDALMVEEHTAVVDARLEAVALEPAAKGAHLKARLKIGGKVVRVEAISPGRASFAPESEVEP